MFGLSTGQQLLQTVFYYCGKFFGLRLSKQTDLTYNQIQQGFDNHNRPYIEYHGKKEKTPQGGLHHRKVQFKNVRHCVLADDAYIPSEKD